jgi:hypothetical protein
MAKADTTVPATPAATDKAPKNSKNPVTLAVSMACSDGVGILFFDSSSGQTGSAVQRQPYACPG